MTHNSISHLNWSTTGTGNTSDLACGSCWFDPNIIDESTGWRTRNAMVISDGNGGTIDTMIETSDGTVRLANPVPNRQP